MERDDVADMMDFFFSPVQRDVFLEDMRADYERKAGKPDLRQMPSPRGV